MSDFNLTVFILLGSCPKKEIPALMYPLLGEGGGEGFWPFNFTFF